MEYLVKICTIVFIITFFAVVIISIIGNIYESKANLTEQYKKQLGVYFKILFFGLLLILAFSVIPPFLYLFLKSFTGLQISLGNEKVPVIKFLINNQSKIILYGTFAYWGFFIAGLIISFQYLKQIVLK